MNHKSIIFYTLIFLGLTLFGISLTLNALTNVNLLNLMSNRHQTNQQQLQIAHTTCSDLGAIQGLDKATNPMLKKLATYQQACGSFVAGRFMIFTDMPKDNNEAANMAANMATQLKEFHAYQITPIVIVEPTASWGLIDFREFKAGLYTDWLRSYFLALRNQGIGAEEMGIWVPFPEPNAPLWNREGFAPEEFGQLVNIYASQLKAVFPTTEVSLLFNSTSYDALDVEYANGEYASFLPWLQTIKPGMVDSFGIQGFPWLPRATTPGAGITNPNEFLNPRLLTEAANQLNTKKVWLNTGTFYSKYTQNSDQTIFVPASDRKAIASGIAKLAEQLKNQDYQIWVNIFAEDKSETAEATDWSYWKNPTDTDNPHRTVFMDFIRKLHQAEIPVSLFDQ